MGEWQELVKTLGLPGAIVALVAAVLAKSQFGRHDEPNRNDIVMKKLDQLRDEVNQGRRENEAEFRGIRDRMTTVETISKEQARRLDRLER